MSSKEYDHLFKLVLIGDSGVGKSSLLLRFADSTFTDNYISTIGVDFRFRSIELPGPRDSKLNVKLQIWDTAGQERFRTITSAYYRGSDAIVLCFDLTNKESFLHVEEWLKEIEKYASDECVKVIVGNKLDLFDASNETHCIPDEVTAFLDRFKNIEYMQTSAKSGDNVEQTFVKVAANLVLQKQAKQSAESPPEKKKINVQELNQRLGLDDNSCC